MNSLKKFEKFRIAPSGGLNVLGGGTVYKCYEISGGQVVTTLGNKEHADDVRDSGGSCRIIAQTAM